MCTLRWVMPYVNRISATSEATAIFDPLAFSHPVEVDLIEQGREETVDKEDVAP
jgi:hypothetical protein